MDPDVTASLQQINAQITGAGSNPQFPANRLTEIQEIQQRANNLITEYKREMDDKVERLKRDMQDYRDRIQRIVDEVNRNT